MAYAGFLVQVGNYKIPHSWIRAETYNVTKNGQDLDSYRDANGVLQRNSLDHWVLKIEFETPPMKTDKEVEAFIGSIKANYTNAKEKKANVTAYSPEECGYIAQEMYLPDIQFQIYSANSKEVKYKQIRIAMIGY